MPDGTPGSLAEQIDIIRTGFVCGRCMRYVGSLSSTRYLPPVYPVVVDGMDDDEARSLVQFEWHMLGMLRQGKFSLVHPERDGRCVTLQEWAEDEAEDEEEESETGPN